MTQGHYRKSGEPRAVTAAMVNEGSVDPRATLRRPGQTEAWQEKVKKFDRDGPGVVGYYLDLLGYMSSTAVLFVGAKQSNGEVKRLDDPVLSVALSGFKGALQPQADLVAAMVRARGGAGECWVINDPETGYNVVQSLQDVGSNSVRWRDLYSRERVTEKSRVWRSWVPDPYEPHRPASPLRRAIPDLERLRNAVRNQNRSAASRLLTNGILAFPNDPNTQASPYGTGTQPDANSPRGAAKVIGDYLDLAKLAHRDDDSPASMVPFPIEGSAPQFVDIGREIDQSALETERSAIEAFARAVNFPQQLLVSGPGASNHWNEFLLQETAVKMFLSPQLDPVCADILRLHLLPMVETLKSRLKEWSPPDMSRLVVSYDLSFLLRRPTNFQELFDAYRYGVATRSDIADALSIPEMMAIPNGMTEYEHWQLAMNKAGAPYAEVDMDGNLIVPDPMAVDPMEDGGADAGMGVVAQPLGAEDPEALPMPADAGPMVAQALNGPRDSSVAEPTTPTVQASLDTPAEFNEFLAQLGPADKRAAVELEKVINDATVAVNDAVKQLVVDATRDLVGDEAATVLERTPAFQVWASADPAVRDVLASSAGLTRSTVSETIETVFEPYGERISEVLAEESDRFVMAVAALLAGGVLASTIPSASTRWLAPAALLGRSAVLAWLVSRHTPKRPDAVMTPPSAPVFAPPHIVRAVLTAAGGGRVDIADDGSARLGLDRQNQPVPADGTSTWIGNTGWFTGHQVINELPTAVHWQWHHAFLRVPAQPDLEHRSFDGRVFAHPTDVPRGRHPGDHVNCTCAMLPVVVRG